MRAQEFILEGSVTGKIVKTLQIGNYSVIVDQHFYDELIKKSVPEVEAFHTLDKLPTAKAKLKMLAPGESFWLFDNDNRVALGIKKKQDINGPVYYKLNTAAKNKDGSPPWTDTVYPILNVA
jgi:hypothetical protein